MTRTIDRDRPCRCGSLAGRQLEDGSIECLNCGRVETDRFLAAKRSLGGGRYA